MDHVERPGSNLKAELFAFLRLDPSGLFCYLCFVFQNNAFLWFLNLKSAGGYSPGCRRCFFGKRKTWAHMICEKSGEVFPGAVGALLSAKKQICENL